MLQQFYGIVHKDKVVELYNMHNIDKVAKIDINTLRSGDRSIFEKDLLQGHTYIVGDYFAHEAVVMFDDFDEMLASKQRKPWYMPSKEDLLKYAEQDYFEITKEFKVLLNYLTQYFFNGDEERANGMLKIYSFSLQLKPL